MIRALLSALRARLILSEINLIGIKLRNVAVFHRIDDRHIFCGNLKAEYINVLCFTL
jgi:hypothetical protein